ncbi:MAG: hypothetical protein F6K16_40905 [Symploca sp. SIO2B6]|nr:hypothetical protein [Symploca sp. SIO2B6]
MHLYFNALPEVVRVGEDKGCDRPLTPISERAEPLELLFSLVNEIFKIYIDTQVLG